MTHPEVRRIAVPERRDAPGRPIEIAYTRVPGRADAPPILYLAGGPGISGIERARTRLALFALLARHGDVIAIDQRGIGRSRPNLTLPLHWDLPLDAPLTRDAYIEAARRLSRQGRAWAEAEGTALPGYTTVENAADLIALADALDAPRVVLFGGSYGSHLALATLRRHPDRIARALLYGIEGPDDTLKLPSRVQGLLETLDARLAADPAWRGASLVERIAALKRRLDRDPPLVPQQGATIRLGAFDLIKAIANGSGQSRSLAMLPARLAAIEAGDFAWLAEAAWSIRRGPFGNAMAYVADSASGGTAPRLARLAAETPNAVLEDAIDLPFPHVAADWGAPDLGDAFRADFTSEVPALLLSGTLDVRTPPTNGEAVARFFRHGTHRLVDGAAHDTVAGFADAACLGELAHAFLDGRPLPDTPLAVPFAFEPPA